MNQPGACLSKHWWRRIENYTLLWLALTMLRANRARILSKNTRACEVRLVLVWLLFGWKTGTRFFSQSLSVALPSHNLFRQSFENYSMHGAECVIASRTHWRILLALWHASPLPIPKLVWLRFSLSMIPARLVNVLKLAAWRWIFIDNSWRFSLFLYESDSVTRSDV